MLLRLKILCNLLDFGKCLSTNCRNVLAMFVETVLLYGGLNQIIFRFLFLCFISRMLKWRFSENPLRFSSSSYSGFALSKVSLFAELLDRRSLIDWGNCLITCHGWFDEVLMYNNLSFGFLYGWYVPLLRFNVMPRKFTSFNFVWISFLKPSSLNSFIIFFLFRLVCCPLWFLKMINPSSLYNPESSFCISYVNKNNM